jgi:hypothetical protein
VAFPVFVEDDPCLAPLSAAELLDDLGFHGSAVDGGEFVLSADGPPAAGFGVLHDVVDLEDAGAEVRDAAGQEGDEPGDVFVVE